MEQLKEMVQARGRLKASLTRLCQFATHPPAGCDIDVVETMLSRLNAAWIEFERIGDSMCRHDSVEGYDTAWERLIERYNRPRHVVNSLLEAFMELPTTKISNVSVLRKVTDGANEIVRGLDAIGQPGRDCWIAYLLLAKLDPESRRKWAEISQDNMSPTIDDLFKFLDARCEEFELSQGHATAEAATCNNNNDKSKKSTRNLMATGQGACVKCGSTEHLLFGCSQFHNMSIEQRRSYIKDKLLCFNCLKPGHTSAKCGSAHSCKHCRGRHNTLLHTQVPPLQSSANQTQQIKTASEDSQEQKISLVTNRHISQAPRAATCILSQGRNKGTLRNAHGTFTACRVLLDSGSELSYVSERCIHALGIARSPSRIFVSGISSVKAETTRGFSKLHLRSRVSDNTLDATVHILGKITSPLARDRIDASSLEIFDKLPLADPMFNTTSPIDILLGTDYVWAAFTGDKKLDSHGNVIAISSIFGWIITAITITRKAAATTLFSSIDINASLQRLWELEDTNTDLPPDPEDLKVEEHLRDTHTRDAEGRYIVKLPFKKENTTFANTLQGATSRFEAAERRLLRNTDLQSRYVQFMQDYESLGHMRELTHDEIHSHQGRAFYMPHHPVVGQKLRVVFDGSFQDRDGHALNDALHIGPSIQRNLFHEHKQKMIFSSAEKN
ncbi:hypothetical protein ACLKA7_000985 [Drosophila subpalustris]